MSQIDILKFLNKHSSSSLTMQDLARLTGLCPSTTSVNLRKLIDHKHVKRERPLGHKVSIYRITKEGQKIIKQEKEE